MASFPRETRHAVNRWNSLVLAREVSASSQASKPDTGEAEPGRAWRGVGGEGVGDGDASALRCHGAGLCTCTVSACIHSHPVPFDTFHRTSPEPHARESSPHIPPLCPAPSSHLCGVRGGLSLHGNSRTWAAWPVRGSWLTVLREPPFT